MAARFLLLSLLPLTALAHFRILTPPPLGSNESGDSSPCGGPTPDLSSTQNVRALGEPIVVQSSHAQSNWLVRATLDGGAAKDWVELYPIFQQSGLGTFCLPEVTVPSEFVGRNGFVSVVASGDDGMLYQCIAANFVNGTGTPGSDCTNSTGVTLSATSDSSLSALLGTPSGDSGSGSGSGSSGDGNSAASGIAALSMAGILGLSALVAGATFGL